MSMITGCPACGTLFKVVPDQLKVSEGWVRCGHCSEVFDAAAHLQAEAPAAPDAVVQDTTAPETAPPLLDAAAPAPVPDVLPDAQVDLAMPATDPAPVPLPLRQPESAAAREAPDSGAAPAPLAVRDASPLSEPFATDSDYVREVEAIRSASADASFAPGGDEAAAALQDVGFVRSARRQARWRRPMVRALLALAACVLALLLAVQVGLQQHDRLASDMPGLRPALQALCEAAGCRLQPPRRIEALVIDGSGFTRLRGDAYRLSVTVRNQATGPAAVPHLELTLTDTQDQPVVRRVLSPADLGAAADSIAGTADWSASAVLSLAMPASANRVAGYRLIAFYP